MKLVTKKQVIKIQKYSPSGIPDISPTIKVKKQFRPCKNCEERQKFLGRVFVGLTESGKGKWE